MRSTRAVTLEAEFRIWNDSTGEYVAVGDDSDGLDMLEIRYVDESGKRLSEVRLDIEHAPALIEAVQRFYEFAKSRSSSKGDGT